MTPEGKVTAQIRKFLRPLEKSGELFVVKIHGSAAQRAGLPDLHLTYRGQSIWLEIKAPGNVATPLQLHTIQKIRNAGGMSHVVTSVTAVRMILESLGLPPTD